jgi:acyl CoA:acetate/3-ketoacid CoA transferase alpha subunit
MKKLCSLQQAASVIKDGDRIMVGGFGLSGTPLSLLESIVRFSKATDLTTISNNCGDPGRGLGRLLLEGRIRKAIGSFFTGNPDVSRFKQEGRLEVELLPQGTLAEGKETKEFDGQMFVLERTLKANVAIIKAHKADEYGNLIYRKTAQNFNPLMAMAADIVVAEVDEIVPLGALTSDSIVTPHIFVDWVVLTDREIQA